MIPRTIRNNGRTYYYYKTYKTRNSVTALKKRYPRTRYHYLKGHTRKKGNCYHAYLDRIIH